MTRKKADKTPIPDDIKLMSFEDAYSALKAATDRLESDEVNLEETLKEYERASALARHCVSLLDEAENRVRVLMESEGTFKLADLDQEETD